MHTTPSVQQYLKHAQEPRPVFKAPSDQDLEAKKRLAEAPKRKSHVRAAAAAGDVQTILSFLETIQDPKEATALAVDAHTYLTRYNHTSALCRLENECGDIFGRQDFPNATSAHIGIATNRVSRQILPAVQYDHKTAQILTGKVGSIMLHVDRGVNLPVKDGTAGSSDPFVRVILWEKKEGIRYRAMDLSTEIKLMTLNPTFKEDFILHVNTPDSELELTVYDWDEDGTHDFMGKVVVPLREFVEDLIQQRNTTYQQNLKLAKAIAVATGSKNIVGRSLGGTAVPSIDELYGADTSFGVVGWDDATGIQALATGVQRSSELPQLRPTKHYADLTTVSGAKSLEGGQLVFTVTFVPAFRPKTIANVSVFPRKSLEHITPMTPATNLIFEEKEYLHSSIAEDASWSKSRTLTDDVMWPKDSAVPSTETCLTMRSSLAYLTWRNMIEPTRPYKQALPPGVCKDPKTGMDEIEEKAYQSRREGEELSMRMANRLWDQQGPRNVSVKEKVLRGASKALDARSYRVRSDASKAISQGKALFEENQYSAAIVRFENALKIATDGDDREMTAASHKWLGDSWRVIGDFRKARDHHTKHLHLKSAVVLDISGDQGARNKSQVLALCRQENLNGTASKYVLNKIAMEKADQYPPKDLALVVQEARSYHSDQYWLNRARERLDSVNWNEGASRLTMDLVRDAMHDMKRERAGEQKPLYVKPSMWGELSHKGS